MNQKKINSTPVCIEVEIPNAELHKNDDCEVCDSRFKCWTSRGMLLRAEEFSISSGGLADEKIKFVGKVPNCFRCNNITGAYAIFHLNIGGLEQYIKSIIMKQEICAEVNRPMTLEIEAMSKFDL